MKKKIYLLEKQKIGQKIITPSSSYLSFIAALFFLLSFPKISEAQQFVKMYKPSSPCTSTTGNLVLNSITRSNKTAVTFYVAGMQDASIYIAEVDAMGVVLQEKLIGVNSNTYVLRSMITDDDGNIVIVGTLSATYPTIAFLMKVSPALSLMLHRTYNNVGLDGLSQVYFTDVKDFKKSGTYYVAGGMRDPNNATGADVLLLTLDRNTGNIVAANRGHVSEDNYDALVINPSSNSTTVKPSILATGRLSHGPISTMRPWINLHTATLAFSKGARYIINETSNARVYSSSLVTDGQSLLYCWHGDISAALSVGKNSGIASFNSSTLVPNWQKQYTLLPASQNSMFFNKVATDPAGYVAQGNWWNGSVAGGGYIGEMILLRTDKIGNPVWSRKINNVFINSASHNAGFVIEGNSIFAVGYKSASSPGFNEGVLVRIPLLDGAIDTLCAPILTVSVKAYQYNAKDSIARLDSTVKDSTIYSPINCTKTDTITNCNQPCLDTLTLDADFDLNGLIQKGNTTNYIVTASSFNSGPNSQWIVSNTTLASPYPDVAGTIYSSIVSGTWATASSTQFGGYVGTSSCTENTGASLSFLMGKRYRFKHILTTSNNCGGPTRSDTVAKTIYMCPGCRGVNGLVIETEKASASSLKGSFSENQSTANENNLRLIPNPVNGSTITLEYAALNNNPVQLIIQDMQGRKLVGKQFTTNAKSNGRYTMDVSSLPNGTYSMVISSDGKTTTQKFVIAK